MTHQRYSTAGAKLASAILLLGSTVLLMPALSTEALSASASARMASADVAKVETAVDEPTTTSTTSDEDAGCYRSRKKLWVDGEGWIVRRVTLCR